MQKVNCAFKPFSAASPRHFGAARELRLLEKGWCSLPWTPMATNKHICLPSTEKSPSATLSDASAGCLDFFSPRIIGGVSVFATAEGFTHSMDPCRDPQHCCRQMNFQLIPKKRVFLLYLPKFMHHLACPERHVMVKKLTVLDFLSWNSIIFFSISWAELYLEMFQPR